MDSEYVTNLQSGYDAVAQAYADHHFDELSHKPLDRALLAAFAEMVRGRGFVADVGCGPGQLARYLSELGLDTIGIDLSPGMLAVARKLSPGIEFIQASMLDLPLPDASLAGVAPFYSVIHLPPPDRPRAFAEFHRVLHPNGVLLLAFHVGDETLHADEFFGKPVSLDFHFVRPQILKRELVTAGFAIKAYLEREPYIDYEHPSTRGYVLAVRQERPASNPSPSTRK